MMTADSILTSTLLAHSQDAPLARATENPTDPRAAAVEFEQVFIAQMLEQMFAGVPTDGIFGGGNGESIFRSLLNNEYATLISRSGGVGIADAVHREIIRLQESETP